MENADKSSVMICLNQANNVFDTLPTVLPLPCHGIDEV